MFVKIKLESEENSQKPHIFEIEDGATTYDLKVQLEALVGVPVDRQEIHSMAQTLGNDDRLTTLLGNQDLGDIENFYSPSEVDTQRKFFLQPEDARKLPIDRLPQYCELSDSEDSTSSSVSTRTNTSFESASTGSSSPEHKRRRVIDADGAPAKRQRISTFIETLTLTSKEGKSEALKQEERINTVLGSKNLTCPKSSVKVPSCGGDIDEEEGASKNNVEVATMPRPKQSQDTKKVILDKMHVRPPYARTMPENRQYGLVISSEDPTAESVDIKAFLRHFFSLFENCSANHLKFSESTTMAKFSSNLLIGCEDNKTADWVTSAVADITPPHSCLPFVKFFRLARCSFVLPLMVADKPLRSIFELLEMQNSGLVTDKWSVVGRKILDPCSDDFEQRAVSSLCENEEIDLYIDAESQTLILEQCSKLKYCFWRLRFEFNCKV